MPKIINLTNEDRMKFPPLPKTIPKHPFRIVMSAPSYSGKTNIIINLIKSKHFYRDFFDVIFILSKTFKDDTNAWGTIKLDEKYIRDEIDEELIINVMKSQEETREKLENEDSIDEMPRILFIIDDLMNEVSISKRDPVSKLFSRGRHFNCSTIITTQLFSGLNPTIRKSASHYIFLRNQEDEMLKAGKENAYHLGTPKRFYNLFKYIQDTGEDYDFLGVDRSKRGIGMFTRNFDDVIDYEGDNLFEFEELCDCGECGECKHPNHKPDPKEELELNLVGLILILLWGQAYD